MKLNFHKNHQLLYSVIFWGFVFLSLIIAVFPALWVQKHNEPLPSAEPMTALEKKGLSVYINEGCVYCHTQQVRPIKMDQPWGRPSAPGDYALIGRPGIWRQTPAVLGSARTGPDLSNIGERQPSAVWQYMHLYNPRSVVKESIMPSFPWLFEIKENPGPGDTVVPVPGNYTPENGKVVATDEAEALIAYLLSMKQASLDAPAASRQMPRLQQRLRRLKRRPTERSSTPITVRPAIRQTDRAFRASSLPWPVILLLPRKIPLNIFARYCTGFRARPSTARITPVSCSPLAAC